MMTTGVLELYGGMAKRSTSNASRHTEAPLIVCEKDARAHNESDPGWRRSEAEVRMTDVV